MSDNMTTTMICSFLFIICRHPLLMALIVTLQTLSIVFTLYLLSWSMWISYLLVLIFLGGLLVIFIYLAALMPNSLFYMKFSTKMFFLAFVIFFYLNFFFLSSENVPLMTNFSSMFFKTTMMMMMLYLVAMLFSSMYLLEKTKTPLKANT